MTFRKPLPRNHSFERGPSNLPFCRGNRVRIGDERIRTAVWAHITETYGSFKTLGFKGSPGCLSGHSQARCRLAPTRRVVAGASGGPEHTPSEASA